MSLYETKKHRNNPGALFCWRVRGFASPQLGTWKLTQGKSKLDRSTAKNSTVRSRIGAPLTAIRLMPLQR